MSLTKKQRIAITCITLPLALLIAWFWNPFTGDDAHGAVVSPGSAASVNSHAGASGPSSKRACPREDTCWPAGYPKTLARKFTARRLGASNGLLPRPVRAILNRKYKAMVVEGQAKAGGAWWNTPCRSSPIVCGGRYCQVKESFGTRERCLDPGWSGPFGINWNDVRKVTFECGTDAVLGFLGGAPGGRKVGWWGAGIGGGGCLFKQYGHRVGWY